MSSFEPSKRHLRELLIYFFHLRKSATEAHRLLVGAYGEAYVLSERSCREWYQKFKNGEFDVEDKKRSGRPKVYEDAKLEALLNKQSCQTQEALALALGVSQAAISLRLKSLGIIQKESDAEGVPKGAEVKLEKKKGKKRHKLEDEETCHLNVTNGGDGDSAEQSTVAFIDDEPERKKK